MWIESRRGRRDNSIAVNQQRQRQPSLGIGLAIQRFQVCLHCTLGDFLLGSDCLVGLTLGHVVGEFGFAFRQTVQLG